MKTFCRLFVLSIFVLCSSTLLVACGNKDNSSWKAIAEATIAEQMKADANFKITKAYVGINDVYIPPQETIIDGSKIKNDNNDIYWAKYIHFENDSMWFYLDHEDVWYKSPTDKGSQTKIAYTILTVLQDTLTDMKNIKYKGNNKYTYRFVAENYIDVVGYNPVFDYTFITNGTKVTEIHLRDYAYIITYGGQTVTLPDATEPTKLAAPTNLSITDGILSWDAVDGATEYLVSFILPHAPFHGGSATVTTNEFDIAERFIEKQASGHASGVYEVTVRAIFPVWYHTYSSDESTSINYACNW